MPDNTPTPAAMAAAEALYNQFGFIRDGVHINDVTHEINRALTDEHERAERIAKALADRLTVTAIKWHDNELHQGEFSHCPRGTCKLNRETLAAYRASLEGGAQ